MPSSSPSSYRRPENAPAMPDVCPICLETLFDSQTGVAVNGEVAKIMCHHLVHSDCLTKAGRSLNADGQRYGVGGHGGPRAGCPVCGKGVSVWMCFKQAAAFPVFWMHRIQKCLEEIGPSQGPVPVSKIQQMLGEDLNLSSEHKKYLYKRDARFGLGSDLGFQQALCDGDSVWTEEVYNGGPQNGGSIWMGDRPGPWDYDQKNSTLWLYKWSLASGMPSTRPSATPMILPSPGPSTSPRITFSARRGSSPGVVPSGGPIRTIVLAAAVGIIGVIWYQMQKTASQA